MSALSNEVDALNTTDTITATRKRNRVVTRREEEVLQLIADGCSTPEVAKALAISQKTVKNHLTSIYQKLDARDRTQAILQALRLGIVTLD
jgi:two-component system response regulator DegU